METFLEDFLGWKFDGISFDYTKKTHESCFPKKTPKAVNGLAAYALRKPATLWNVGSPG